MFTLALTAISVLGLDQVTKFLAIEHLSPAKSIGVIPGIFHLSFVENTGIAFGLFQGQPVIMTVLITLCVLALLICSPFFVRRPLGLRLAYGFILGGAVGNWVDRIRYQHVIDFLDFRVWPVFNFADTFISIGMILFLWYSFRKT